MPPRTVTTRRMITQPLGRIFETRASPNVLHAGEQTHKENGGAGEKPLVETFSMDTYENFARSLHPLRVGQISLETCLWGRGGLRYYTTRLLQYNSMRV